MPAWLGRVLEPLYRAEIGRRNRRFDRGVGVERLPVPVISVGNLSVGGTGKTPMVMHVVRLLLEAGRKPCVAMRGYAKTGKRRDEAGERRLINPSAGELLTPLARQALTERRPVLHSDEADQYRRAFPGMPVVARADRIVGLRELLEKPFQPTVDCVVLDDGFQHRQIARDLDIVLVDASRPPQLDHLLPRGYLREPLESLRRASCVVITHAELAEVPLRAGEAACDADECRVPVSESPSLLELTSVIVRHHGKPPLAVTSHLWTGFVRARSHNLEDDEELGLDVLLGRRVVGACAIGHPRAFLAGLERNLSADKSRPGKVVETMVLGDHDPFEEPTARRLAEMAARAEADAIVVTDKDWSKLRRFPSKFWPCPVYRPVLSLVFSTGGEALRGEVEKTSQQASGTRHQAPGTGHQAPD